MFYVFLKKPDSQLHDNMSARAGKLFQKTGMHKGLSYQKDQIVYICTVKLV